MHMQQAYRLYNTLSHTYVHLMVFDITFKYKYFSQPFQHGSDDVQHVSCNQLPELTCPFWTRVALTHIQLSQTSHLHSYKQNAVYK